MANDFDPEPLLDSTARARADHSRWFGWWLLGVGLLLVPSGLVVPWSTGERNVVTLVTIVLLVAAVVVARAQSVVPRWGVLTGSVVAWLVVSVLLASIAPDDVSLAAGLALGAVSSLAFWVPGAWFLLRRT